MTKIKYKKNEYKTYSANLQVNSQCNLQTAIENIEVKEKTAAEASYFYSILIVAKCVLHE